MEYIVDGQNPQASDHNNGTIDKPLKTISKAAELAHAGDNIIVKPGIYREAIILSNSGTPEFPISFIADPPGSVIVTGADIITDWKPFPNHSSIYYTTWKSQFIINHKKDGTPIEHHPEDAPVWGRAEQVIVDGYHLAPVGTLDELLKYTDQEHEMSMPLKVPNPKDPATWYGVFAVDTKKKELYIHLSDSSDPNKHQVESSSRGLIFGTNPWINRNGIENVQVFGFIFRYGASFPQRPAVWLHGKNNLIENCIIEDMSGSGIGVGGIMKRCIVRRCGHTGGGANGDSFLNEECLWEENCWKPINRDWDAGGFKLAWSNGGIFRRCVFRHNGGPGLWFDIHVRNVLVTDCVFQENESSGLFIEISRDITVLHNLMVRNGLKAEGHSWSASGIQIAESINCIVAYNTCIANKDGITFREQGPRPLDTEDFGTISYHNIGHVILGNVCAYNKGYQLGFWYDNGFFGWHPSEKSKYITEEAYNEYLKTIQDKIYDPTKQNIIIDRNIYYADQGQKMILYGVTWRPKHQEFADINKFKENTGFDRRSIVVDPMFVNTKSDNYRFKHNSPAWTMQAGWLMVPSDIDKWMDSFLTSFR
ncbi:MAG: right-handed parallel beta-helix repeat-containing protein [bacterium]